MNKRDLLYINKMFRELAGSMNHAIFTTRSNNLSFEDIAEVGKRTTRRFGTIHDEIVADKSL